MHKNAREREIEKITSALYVIGNGHIGTIFREYKIVCVSVFVLQMCIHKAHAQATNAVLFARWVEKSDKPLSISRQKKLISSERQRPNERETKKKTI